jgi:hypothetical protein
MHRRSEIDCALSSMTPEAAPVAPLGLVARQCHADAEVETAAAIVAPANKAMKKRPIIGSLWFNAQNSKGPLVLIKGAVAVRPTERVAMQLKAPAELSPTAEAEVEQTARYG